MEKDNNSKDSQDHGPEQAQIVCQQVCRRIGIQAFPVAIGPAERIVFVQGTNAPVQQSQQTPVPGSDTQADLLLPAGLNASELPVFSVPEYIVSPQPVENGKIRLSGNDRFEALLYGREGDKLCLRKQNTDTVILHPVVFIHGKAGLFISLVFAPIDQFYGCRDDRI